MDFPARIQNSDRTAVLFNHTVLDIEETPAISYLGQEMQVKHGFTPLLSQMTLWRNPSSLVETSHYSDKLRNGSMEHLGWNACGVLSMLDASGPGEDTGLGAVIDIETTGLKAHIHEIVELALVLFTFRRSTLEVVCAVDCYVGLQEPTRPYALDAMKVHGIPIRDVRGRSVDRRRIGELIEKSELIVAHNAQFDRAFVGRLIPSSTRKPWLCSLTGIDWQRHGCTASNLDSLLHQHGYSSAPTHRAEPDARALLWLLSQRGAGDRPYFHQLVTGNKRAMKSLEINARRLNQ
jgi:DNA polymerase-3 subunit epsilon